jgi:hypothetical protein
MRMQEPCISDLAIDVSIGRRRQELRWHAHFSKWDCPRKRFPARCSLFLAADDDEGNVTRLRSIAYLEIQASTRLGLPWCRLDLKDRKNGMGCAVIRTATFIALVEKPQLTVAGRSFTEKTCLLRILSIERCTLAEARWKLRQRHRVSRCNGICLPSGRGLITRRACCNFDGEHPHIPIPRDPFPKYEI